MANNVKYGDLVVYSPSRNRVAIGIVCSQDALTGKYRIVPVGHKNNAVKRDVADLLTLDKIKMVKETLGK